MKKILMASSLVLATSAFAASNIPLEQQISSFTVEEVTPISISSLESRLSNRKTDDTGGSEGGQDQTPPATEAQKPSFEQKVETSGKVIQLARDMVALGEAIYELVKKGRPTNITEYAPISVVPRDPISKEYAEPFELEGFSMPVERNFVAKVKNGMGKEVVNFSYKVMYSYGGSFNGSGKYLTNVIIVPGEVRTTFGWDFNATMKLSGIMNHGTKAEPVAGIMVTMKYQMNSWSTAFERNDTIHITGAGEVKNHSM
jgi:hypothetical protein